MNNKEVIAKVTAKIIEQLKAGVKPWECSWDRTGGQLAIPRNVKTGKDYHGINRLCCINLKLSEQKLASSLS